MFPLADAEPDQKNGFKLDTLYQAAQNKNTYPKEWDEIRLW